MKRLNVKKKIAAALLLGMVIGVTGMWLMFNCILDSRIVAADKYSKYQEMSKAGMLYDYIQEIYYQDVDGEVLAEGMYKGMVESLDDPYSEYFTASEYKAWQQDMNGAFYGVGLTMQADEKKKGQLIVKGVVKDSPAEKAGFVEGDIVTKVDGKSYEDLNSAVQHIRGEKGTEVKLTYLHNGKEEEKTLVREKINLESVGSRMLDDKIGYILITTFSENTGKEFKDALSKLEKDGAKGLVIDLRNNGGGLVLEGIKVVDELLGKCTVVEYIDNQGNKSYSYSDESKTKLPYVVLVNGATASASEIVTAAIKDNEGGKIIGTNTFGKGIIQSTKRLKDGSAIKLTIVEYRSPEGHKIHGKGIKPDYVVKLKKNDRKDYQLEKALDLLTN